MLLTHSMDIRVQMFKLGCLLPRKADKDPVAGMIGDVSSGNRSLKRVHRYLTEISKAPSRGLDAGRKTTRNLRPQQN